eukprot:207816-Pyramimonas_sp.AAC.1
MWTTEQINYVYYDTERIATGRPTRIDSTSNLYAIYDGHSHEHSNPLDDFVDSVLGSMLPGGRTAASRSDDLSWP